jgi:ribonuclease HI
MKRKKSKSIGDPKTVQPIVFYTDGSGARPDGMGSAIAWVREDCGEEHFELVDGLTNNQAEYRAIISALESCPSGSLVKIASDSQLVICQIRGEYRVYDPDLADLRNSVNDAVLDRDLNAKFTWIPRSHNRADKLLQRKKQRAPVAKPEAEV